MIEQRKKKVYRTSFRSEIHATDSTCNGWIPKSNPTINDIKTFLLIKYKSHTTSIQLSMCNKRFTV